MTDGRGNTRLVMNAGKNITASVGYDAWGYQLGSTFNTPGPLAPYQWNAASGYRADGDEASGFLALQKVGARYYDPEFGCFLTRDSDLGQKPYAYCNGDPVNFNDPSGHRQKKSPPITVPTTSTPIPAGNSGATYTPGSGTISQPISTGNGGTVTPSGGPINNGDPTQFGLAANQPLGGGNISLSGNYNSANGTFTGGGSYNHPIGGGFSGGVSFGSGSVPGYSLNFSLNF